MNTFPVLWAASANFLGIPVDWWGPVALAAFIVAGIIFSFRLKREERAERPATPDEMLAELHASYAQGKMNSTEFERVRDSLTRMATAQPGPVHAAALKPKPPAAQAHLAEPTPEAPQPPGEPAPQPPDNAQPDAP
jgi:hypothetical protein